MARHKHITLSCPDCIEETIIIEDTKNGYNVCSACGCTIGPRIIDEGSEWRTFGDSSGADPSHVGGPSNPLLNSEQLDTVISGTHALARTQMKSTMRGPERALLNGFNLISTYSDRASIPSTVQDKARLFFKKILELKVTRGKNTEAVVAACIHLACKHLGCARTFKEVSVICNVRKEEIGKSYKLIEKHFTKMTIVMTEDIVERFCTDLSLDLDAQKMAGKISRRARESGCIAGKSPVSVAAAVVYMVSYLYARDRKIQREIHIVANVSEVTIKNTYKELLVHRHVLILEEDFPREVVDSLPNT